MESIFYVIQAIIYGIVQGITEFLPISSSAHLMLLPKFLGWEEPGNLFDMALHFGTAIAIIAFFFKDWLRLFKAGFTDRKSADGKLFWTLVAATIPPAIVGLVFNDAVKPLQENTLIVGILLLCMGIVLYIADAIGKKRISLEEIGVSRGLLIGSSQILAIIPGVSRAGITMTSGRLLGMQRESIARYSFLLSTPLLTADALYSILKIHQNGIENLQISGGWITLFIGIAVSFIVGIFVIQFLLNLLKTKGFLGFAVYRVILGGTVIAFTMLNLWPN